MPDDKTPDPNASGDTPPEGGNQAPEPTPEQKAEAAAQLEKEQHDAAVKAAEDVLDTGDKAKIKELDPDIVLAALSKKNSENKNLRDRLHASDAKVTELTPLAEERQAQIEKDKTELQKAQDAQKALQDKLDAADRTNVQNKYKLTDAQMNWLPKGLSADELATKAEELLETFKVNSGTNPPAGSAGLNPADLEGGHQPNRNGKVSPKDAAKGLRLD